MVAVRNSREELARCVAAIEGSAWKRSREVILVDDGSRPPLAEQLPLAGGRWIRMEKRQGPATARNLGAREAGGRYLVFVDADVMVRPEAIERLIRPLEVGRADAVQGVYDREPGTPDLFCRFWTAFQAYKNHVLPGDELRSAGTYLLATTREFFLGSGGLCEGFGPAEMFEDIEWSNRVRLAGAQLQRVSEAAGIHLRGFGPLSYFRYQIRNSSSKVRLALGLRRYHGRVTGPPLGGMPESRSRPLILGSLLSLAMVGAGLGLAAPIAGPRALFAVGLVALTLLFLASQWGLLLFASRGSHPVGPYLSVPMSFYTCCAWGVGILVGLLWHLLAPVAVPEPGNLAPHPLLTCDSSREGEG